MGLHQTDKWDYMKPFMSLAKFTPIWGQDQSPSIPPEKHTPKTKLLFTNFHPLNVSPLVKCHKLQNKPSTHGSLGIIQNQTTATHCVLCQYSQQIRYGISLRCPSKDEYRKMQDTHKLEYFLTVKNEILSFAAKQMELESIMLIEISQIQIDKYHSVSHL